MAKEINEAWLAKRAAEGKLVAVKIGSAIHVELWNRGWRTHHVDGQIDWMEFAGNLV